MDIIYAYFNVSWYHVVSLKLLQQFAFVWLLIEIFRKKCLKVNKKLIIIILLLVNIIKLLNFEYHCKFVSSLK